MDPMADGPCGGEERDRIRHELFGDSDSPCKDPGLQHAKAKLQYAKAELHYTNAKLLRGLQYAKAKLQYAKAELHYAKAELQYKNATNASQDRDARVEAERKLLTAHKRRAWRKLVTALAKARSHKPNAMKDEA